MIRNASIVLASLFAFITPHAFANDLLPPHVIKQLGLTEAWVRPVRCPAGSQSIVDQQLFVHQEDQREFVEIVRESGDAADSANETATQDGAADSAETKQAATTGKVLARIATDQLGLDGKPIGRKEAERQAMNQIRRLKRRGIDAKINVRTVPRVHMYTIAVDGSLECRDAETGEPIWMTTVGDRGLTYGQIGVSEKHLAIINGGNLIKVDVVTGDVMEEVELTGAPTFGALIAGEYAVVPLIGGGIAGYPMYDPTIDPFVEIVAGSALAMPTKAPDSTRTGWGTDRSFVYFMELQGTPSVLFRVKTDGIVSGRLASAPNNRFFFGSEEGQVYGVRATASGRVMWSTPVGEPIYNEPMVIDDQVVLRTTYGNLFSLNINDGTLHWPHPNSNVADLIAGFNGRLYLTTLSGVFGVVDLASGRRVATFNEVQPGRFLVNHVTDRLYLVSDRGIVQCLHAEGADLPTLAVPPDAAPEPEESKEKTEAKPEPAVDPFGAGATDPFGAGAGGNDPFGAGGDADPFGGGNADPFGGGADMGGDPFGGGADQGNADDPFGGNPFGN